jgi:hypothetical protein
MGLQGVANVLDRSSIVRFGAIFSGAYVGWLFLFERLIEPRIRHIVGAVVGRPIVWVSAHVGLRIWGLRGPHPRKAEAAVSLCGALLVVSSAFFPAIAATLAARVAAFDSALSASVYLISPPMAAIFVYHVLSRGPDGP